MPSITRSTHGFGPRLRRARDSGLRACGPFPAGSVSTPDGYVLRDLGKDGTMAIAADIDISLEPLAADAIPDGGLEGDWRALAEVAEAPFCLTWDWIGPWLRHCAERPFLVRARIGGETAGLAILSHRREVRLKLRPVNVLYLHETGDPERDKLTIEYNDVLCRPDRAADIRNAVIAALIQSDMGHWDELHVGGMRESVAATIAPTVLKRRNRAERATFAVDLTAIRADGFVAGLGKNTRAQIRRSMRLYEQMYGPLALDRASTVEEAHDWLDQLGLYHQRQWVARGKPGAFANPHFLPVHRDIIAAAHGRGGVEVLRLRAGDDAIGYLYNFVHRDEVSFYTSGLNYEDDPKLKPGLVIHALAIEDHRQRGAHTYDFMAGDNRYKRQLGSERERLLDVRFARRSAAGAVEDGLRALRGHLSGR